MNDKTAKEFSASEKDSFAEFTVRERFPKIFKEVCSEQYDEFIECTTVADGIKEGDHAGLAALKKAVAPYNDKTLKQFFHDEPFFLVEFYFYHLLLCKRNYGKLRFDFFAFKKDASYKDKGAEYSKLLEILFKECKKTPAAKTDIAGNDPDTDEDVEERIKKVLLFSLTSNTGDLSQLHEIKSETVFALCDETDCCIGYLTDKCYNCFDIICDNSGAELFSDINLAVLCILYGMAKKVILHVKPCPFFVSDATLDDFAKLLALLTANGKNPELQKLLHEQKIEVHTDDFWVQPYYFDSMPDNLKRHFKKSDLVIVKGDLNYRRLVKDCRWEHTDRLKDRSLLRKADGSLIPVIAPRVLKSDLVIGIDPVFEAFAQNKDSQYKTDGKWGVIQTAMNTDGNKLYKKRQKAREKRRKQESSKRKKEERKREKKEAAGKKAKKKEQSTLGLHEKCHYVLFNILFVVMALLVVCVLGVVALSFCQVKDEEIKKSLSEILEHLDFSIVLSALTLLVGGSIVLPKFLLQSEVKTAVENKFKEHADAVIKEKTDGYIKNEMATAKNDMTKLDAHFSRMIAFFLNENYPVWSVGWCFRSLKRYGKLNAASVGFNEYVDFIRFIQKGVLDNAIETFNKKLRECKDADYFKLFEEEAEASQEPSPKRPIIRAIKDIADFEYAVFFTEIQKDTGKQSILKPICLSTGRFAQDLCIILLGNGKKVDKNLLDAETADKWLLNKILEISDYGQKYSKEIITRNDYKEKLSNTLSRLRSERIEPYKQETEPTYFFNGYSK